MYGEIVTTKTAPVTDVRRAVLDAALSVIASDGPDSVSMRDIARRAGVSHQAPYHHFGDRAGVFAAIAAEGFDRIADIFDQILDDGGEPGTDCLAAYVHFAVDNPGHFRVMFRSDLSGTGIDPGATAASERAFEAVVRLANQVTSTGWNERDRALFPHMLWSQAHGIATLLIDGPLKVKLPQGTTVEDLIDSVSRALMRGLSNP